ncbi:MAG: FAD-dependent oxidoreductase, partial [Verrucomicrobiota bacterium]
MNDTAIRDNLYDVIVVGGGAAGVGVAVALSHAGITNFVVLERHTVGASFASWPAETRFITPSFPTNSIGMLDLNSIAVGVSPAFSLKVEHPGGGEYAAHLRHEAAVSRGHEVAIFDTLKFSIDLEQGNPQLFYCSKQLEEWDAVIPRIGASITHFGTAVVRQFE